MKDDRERAVRYADQLEAHMNEGCKFGPNNVRDLIQFVRELAASDAAWEIMFKHEARWNGLHQSEKEAVLQKALDDTVAENIRLQDAHTVND